MQRSRIPMYLLALGLGLGLTLSGRAEGLAERLSSDSGVEAEVVERVLQSLEKTVLETLSAGDRLQMPGLGTFVVGARGAEHRRHPITGKRQAVGRHRHVVWGPSPELLAAFPRWDQYRGFYDPCPPAPEPDPDSGE